MKTFVNLGFGLLLSAIILLPSCKKSNTVQVTLYEVLTGGDQYVHLYQEGSQDKTADYLGYLWTFKTDGTLVVTRGALTFNGTWSITAISDTRVNIQFIGTGVEDVLLKLQNDWIVSDYSVDLVQLRNDGSSVNELLHFGPK